MTTKGTHQRKRKNRPVNIRAAERRIRAVELRREGKTFVEIATALGISRTRAFQLVTEAIDETNDLLVTETKKLRQRQQDRIAALVKALWKKATKDGQVGAVDRVIKLLEREARLAGLDAAEKFEHSGPDGGPITIDEIRSDVSARLTALARQRRGSGDGG